MRVRKTIFLTGLFLVAGMALPTFAQAQTKHTPTLEESLSLKSIGSAKISHRWPLRGL
jgi:hypothetical protein